MRDFEESTCVGAEAFGWLSGLLPNSEVERKEHHEQVAVASDNKWSEPVGSSVDGIL